MLKIEKHNVSTAKKASLAVFVNSRIFYLELIRKILNILLHTLQFTLCGSKKDISNVLMRKRREINLLSENYDYGKGFCVSCNIQQRNVTRLFVSSSQRDYLKWNSFYIAQSVNGDYLLSHKENVREKTSRYFTTFTTFKPWIDKGELARQKVQKVTETSSTSSSFT